MTGKPLIIVCGATAVGKTALALEIAQHFSTEIISADSRQLYRYMDIGTAKPTPEQQALVPHHLIDVVNPDETISLAQVVRRAEAAITHLHHDDRPALLVGGTGQYITAIEQGWSIPEVEPDEGLRSELEAFAASEGALALHARLAVLDPEYALRTHPNNVRRVIRALEVCLGSGETMTYLQQQRPVPYRILRVGLRMERDALYARVAQRIDAMMHDGLLAEVQMLLARGYPASLPAMSSIGYRELNAFLQDEITLPEALERMRYNTHHFIRRQEIWFRGHDHGILWHNSPETDAATVTDKIEAWLSE